MAGKHAGGGVPETDEGCWRRRYSVLAGSTTNVVMLRDVKRRRFTEVNASAAAFTGYTIKELLNIDPSRLYSHERTVQYIEDASRCERGVCGYIHGALIVRKDGRTVPVDIATFSFNAGRARCVQEVWRDCSVRCTPVEGRRDVDAEGPGLTCPADFTTLLESCRTLRDSEQRLIESAKMASLGEMGAGIAHELNSPLAGILSITQVLMSRLGPSDPNYHLLETVKDAAVRSKYIILDMLTYASQNDSSLKPIFLNEAIRATFGLFTSEINTSVVKITLDLDPALPKVRGNKGRIMEVMLNLIKNALDAMAGAGALHISTRAVSGPDGEFAVAEVRDSGPGIADDIIGRIFDPFFSTRDRGEGMNVGLGLSIARSIVNRHGGRIEAENHDAGAVFRVYLPLARAGGSMMRPAR